LLRKRNPRKSPKSVAEPIHFDEAPDPAPDPALDRQNDAAPARTPFQWHLQCKIQKIILFDASPAPAPARKMMQLLLQH
jgi:hypothetical protein